MLKRFLSRKTKTKRAPVEALSTLFKLRQTLEMLEKKEHILQKKLSIEVEKAKDFTKLKNKKDAIQCLKKKKLYEAQLEQLGNFQLRVHDQIIMLEGARVTTDTIDALQTGASAVNKIQNSLNVDDIDKTMEEVNENVENMKQIQEAVGAPVGAASDFDEDELEAELDELEELEAEELSELPRPISTSTTVLDEEAPIRMRIRPNDDVEELATLQAAMSI